MRERVKAWRQKLCKRLQKTVVELTGDVSPDVRALERANIVITTPEKWDGISRNWQQRSYVKKVWLLWLGIARLRTSADRDCRLVWL